MIGNPSSYQLGQSFHIKKIYNFHKQTFQNTQLVMLNYIDHHSLLKLLSFLELLACLISLTLVGDIVLELFKMFCSWIDFFLPLHVLSTNKEIKCNEYIYYIIYMVA
jgi:hypothetical protein